MLTAPGPGRAPATAAPTSLQRQWKRIRPFRSPCGLPPGEESVACSFRTVELRDYFNNSLSRYPAFLLSGTLTLPSLLSADPQLEFQKETAQVRGISLSGDNPFEHKNPVLCLGVQLPTKRWAAGSRWGTACSVLAAVASLQAAEVTVWCTPRSWAPNALSDRGPAVQGPPLSPGPWGGT